MQKQIIVKNIAYAYNEHPLLTAVSFRCMEGERFCILGENGTGKSTLLRILSGQFPQDSGQIETTSHMRMIYVPQEFDHKFNDATVDEFIEKNAGITITKRVHSIAKELGLVIEKIQTRKCGTLSGGQQKILMLSCALASNPDCILLDEPENHIDIVSRMVLIRMLQEYRGSIIFISHDRLIIDALATKVGEVAQGQMHISEGGYDDYIETKMERIGGMQRKFDAESKRIKQLETTIVILRQKALRGKEVSLYKKKLEELNDLKGAHKENGRPEEKKSKIRIHQGAQGLHAGKLLMRMKDGSFRYPAAKSDMFRDTSLEIRSGQHIVLLGRNGSGKSTFLKCLTGENKLSTGDVMWTDGTKHAYFDQHSQFDPEARPLHVIMEKLNCLEIDARAVLGSMRFNADKMMTKVGSLSGGEKMRLRFAIVFGLKPDVIIFDEPTNHLDEVTWEILLHACKNSQSVILLVSHDYEFIEAFNPAVFWMNKNQSIVARHKELSVLLEELSV